MLPLETRINLRPIADVPILSAPPETLTSFVAPLFESEIAPVNELLVFVNVIAFAPALKLDVPLAVITPD